MTLAEYRRKRDFSHTTEPRGSVKDQRGRAFVVQKHDATRLHFDLRLEWNGVFLSWAVPKGPSANPAQKRLAIQVEDHPLEYGSFEGTIPAGEYGAGTVMLWDRGAWEPQGDPARGLHSGELKFKLNGQRLQGDWVLVRLRGAQRKKGQANWLLIKERDEYASRSTKRDPVAIELTSVKSGRTMEDIANGTQEHTQQNSSPPNRKRAASQPVLRRATLPARRTRLPPGARRAAMPRRYRAQLATLVKQPPEGDAWLHEVKFDGYRMLARFDRGAVHWISRNGQDWTKRLALLSQALHGLPCQRCVLDGEVVVLDDRGVSRFQRLQNVFRDPESAGQPQYYAFDCLYLDGYDLTGASLRERKSLLQDVLTHQWPRQSQLRFSEHHLGDGAALLREACLKGLEGLISKRSDAPYRPGRGNSWVKSKCRASQELVIGGFTDPAGSRIGFGALLMGYFDDEGEFNYAGRVGTGFDDRILAELSKKMRAVATTKCPFSEGPPESSTRGIHWVQPKLVAQIEFANWTEDNLLRQGVFQGLRDDKPARAIKRDNLPEKNMAPTPFAGGHTRRSAHKSMKALPKLTHPDRVLFPEQGLTKQHLADYYAAVAPWLLPELAGRPLSVVRCPEGTKGKCFFQKHPPIGLADHVRRIQVAEKRGQATYLVADDLPGVISLVQFGVLELHVWGARTDRLERPDRVVFDLDPAPDVSWRDVMQAAQGLRAVLIELGLRSFVKTSGGKGFHVLVPVDRRHSWAEVKEFAHAIGKMMADVAPDRFTVNMSKRARAGKVFIDYLRNDRGATTVAAYSTRARQGAPVSMPIEWDELPALKHAAQFTVENALQRVKSLRHNPWKELSTVRQRITKAMTRRVQLHSLGQAQFRDDR